MINADKIAQINFLAKKQKSEGLNPAEKSEQDTLRREYIDAVKNSVRVQLESVKLEQTDCDSSSHSHDGCSCDGSCGCDHHH